MRVALYAPRFGTKQTPESLSDIINLSDADLFVGAEYLLFAGTGKDIYPLTQKERRMYLNALCTASKDRIVIAPMLWTDDKHYYNSAPIIHDERMADERYKWHASGLETRFADAWNMRFASKKSKPVTTVDGIDLRVEICCDFLFINDPQEADIHVLCASGMTGILFKESMWRVKDGGNALIVDNQQTPLGYSMLVCRRTGGLFLPRVPKRSMQTIHLYVYEVDA